MIHSMSVHSSIVQPSVAVSGPPACGGLYGGPPGYGIYGPPGIGLNNDHSYYTTCDTNEARPWPPSEFDVRPWPPADSTGPPGS